jgi:trans-aconitate methyltransferase
VTPAGREWDADAYQRISSPQVAWGRSVLFRLELSGGELVVDAGCGTGRLTADLLERLPSGRVIAIDLSANMLDVAKRELEPRFAGRVHFAQCDLLHGCLAPSADVVFSTATFHWVLDHSQLFREVHGMLVGGGRLEAQCGGGVNLKRVHDRAMALMKTTRFVRYLAAWKDPWVFADAVTTETRLRAAGFIDVETWLESAPTPMADAESFAEFARTVVLRPYLALFPDDDLRVAFIEELTAQFAKDSPPFVFDYWRLNISATKPG